jgi:hypothetical protein
MVPCLQIVHLLSASADGFLHRETTRKLFVKINIPGVPQGS